MISIYHLLTKFYTNSYQIFVKFYFSKRWSNVKKNLNRRKCLECRSEANPTPFFCYLALRVRHKKSVYLLLGFASATHPALLFTASLSERPLAVPSPLSERGWLRSTSLSILLDQTTCHPDCYRAIPSRRGVPEGRGVSHSQTATLKPPLANRHSQIATRNPMQ